MNVEKVVCLLSIQNKPQPFQFTYEVLMDKLYNINPNLNSINLCYKNALAINYESGLFVKKKTESAAIQTKGVH